jgi:hypothetical protein
MSTLPAVFPNPRTDREHVRQSDRDQPYSLDAFNQRHKRRQDRDNDETRGSPQLSAIGCHGEDDQRRALYQHQCHGCRRVWLTLGYVSLGRAEQREPYVRESLACVCSASVSAARHVSSPPARASGPRTQPKRFSIVSAREVMPGSRPLLAPCPVVGITASRRPRPASPSRHS